MAKITLAGAALAALFGTGAMADGFSPPPAGDWSGPYVGVQLGGNYAHFTNNVPLNPGPIDEAFNVIGGIHAGFASQSGTTVFGGELEYNLSAVEATSAGGSMDQTAVAMARVRVGTVVRGDMLVFGALGIAATRKETVIAGLGSSDDWVTGATVGVGAERMIGDGLSGRLELIYFNVPDDSQNVGGLTVVGGSNNAVIRLGISRRF